jgi:hypothetical protein
MSRAALQFYSILLTNASTNKFNSKSNEIPISCLLYLGISSDPK